MPEKRVMTPEMLQNLAIARVKALEVRRAKKLESDEDKMHAHGIHLRRLRCAPDMCNACASVHAMTCACTCHTCMP